MALAHTPTQKGSKFFKVKDHVLFTIVIPAPDTEPGSKWAPRKCPLNCCSTFL